MNCKKREIAILFIKFIMLLLAGVALYEILGKEIINTILNKITINILAITLFTILTLMIYYYLKYSKSEKQILKIMIGIAKICLIFQIFMLEIFILIGVEENKNIGMYIYFIIVYSLIYFGLYCKDKIIDEEPKKNDDGELFGIREKQAEVLRELIKEHKENSMILIDGEWGIGKTFFVKKALEIEKEEREEVFIDVMMFNGRKALNEEFFNSIENILEENGIMRKSAENLKNQINKISETNNKFINIIIDMIKRETIDKTFIDGKESLGEAIKKLHKKIVLVIDNIERILKHDDIVEILGFLHEMQSIEGIAVIVCADKEKLKAIISKENGEKHEEYIEKFFIQKIEMTKIEPIEIIEHIGKREEYKEYEDVLIKVVKEILENNNRSENNLEVVLKIKTTTEEKNEARKEYENVKKMIIEFESMISIPRNIEKLYEKSKILEKRFNNIYGEKNINTNRYKEIICGISLLNIFYPNEYLEIKNEKYLNLDSTIVVNKEQFILNILRFKLKDKPAYLRIIKDFKISDEDKSIRFIKLMEENGKYEGNIKEKMYLLSMFSEFVDVEDKSITIYKKIREEFINTKIYIEEYLKIINNQEILGLEKRYCIENNLKIKDNSVFSKIEKNGEDILEKIESKVLKNYEREILVYIDYYYKGKKPIDSKEFLKKNKIVNLFQGLSQAQFYDKPEENHKFEKTGLELIKNIKDNVIHNISNGIKKTGEEELINRMNDLFDILEILAEARDNENDSQNNENYLHDSVDIIFKGKSYNQQLEILNKMEKENSCKIFINYLKELKEQEKDVNVALKMNFYNGIRIIEKVIEKENKQKNE